MKSRKNKKQKKQEGSQLGKDILGISTTKGLILSNMEFNSEGVEGLLVFRFLAFWWWVYRRYQRLDIAFKINKH